MERTEDEGSITETGGSMSSLFRKLAEGGPYSLPYLLRLHDESGTDIYLINDTKPCTWNGHTYLAGTFTYSPQDDGDSTLEVETVDAGSTIINLFENNYTFTADITGVLLENGTVQEIKAYHHRYGTATWSGGKAKITFEKDDRLGMTFPALIWTTYNNRGNS